MRAVVFDMDGILFDTEKLCMDSWIAIGEELGIEGIREYMLKCIGRSAKDTEALFYETYGEQYDYPALCKRSSLWIKEYLEDKGMPMKEGVYKILPYLQQSGYTIGLASSTKYDTVVKHLKNANIIDYFQVIVTGDMVENSKPDPEIYLLACKKLEANPEDTYAIEDSPNGIRAAYSAGMKPIMVPDMIMPDEEMQLKSYTICKDLIEVMHVFNH